MGQKGLFSPDNFTFGQTVYLSPIYAAARKVAGVQSVTATVFQPQGISNRHIYLAKGEIPLGPFQIARSGKRSQPSRPRPVDADHAGRKVRMHECCTGTSDCLCGCCSGISVETPQGESNLPGLPAIAYRTGTWATFKESMLARLSSADYPALAELKTRDDDDFSIALLDASSVVLDILTFYQERLANESYLRTAVQLHSLTELARLIGYQPAPGVSASVYLSFSLKAAHGLAHRPGNRGRSPFPKGTQVQSVPAQGQTPQTFETSADILAKADWNALPVQTGVPWTPQLWRLFEGTATQLQLGDSLADFRSGSRELESE